MDCRGIRSGFAVSNHSQVDIYLVTISAGSGTGLFGRFCRRGRPVVDRSLSAQVAWAGGRWVKDCRASVDSVRAARTSRSLSEKQKKSWGHLLVSAAAKRIAAKSESPQAGNFAVL